MTQLGARIEGDLRLPRVLLRHRRLFRENSSETTTLMYISTPSDSSHVTDITLPCDRARGNGHIAHLYVAPSTMKHSNRDAKPITSDFVIKMCPLAPDIVRNIPFDSTNRLEINQKVVTVVRSRARLNSKPMSLLPSLTFPKPSDAIGILLLR